MGGVKGAVDGIKSEARKATINPAPVVCGPDSRGGAEARSGGGQDHHKPGWSGRRRLGHPF